MHTNGGTWIINQTAHEMPNLDVLKAGGGGGFHQVWVWSKVFLEQGHS